MFSEIKCEKRLQTTATLREKQSQAGYITPPKKRKKSRRGHVLSMQGDLFPFAVVELNKGPNVVLRNFFRSLVETLT